MDCSPPGSSVHGIFQARILERVAISSSRGSSQSRDQARVSCIAGSFFTIWSTRETLGTRLKSSTVVPTWPPSPCPPEGAALRMVSSRVLTRQWKGTSGFGRSQTMLGEDSAAGDSKYQNLSKNCLGFWSLSLRVTAPSCPKPWRTLWVSTPGLMGPEQGQASWILWGLRWAEGLSTAQVCCQEPENRWASLPTCPHHTPALPFQGPATPMAVPASNPWVLPGPECQET